MAKTVRDTMKHIRALGEFFSNMGKVQKETLDYFAEQYEKKKYLKQSVKRMIERGIIHPEKNAYVLTKKGKKFFEKKQIIPYPAPAKDWDGRWRVISFDVPGDYNIKREHLRCLLKEFHFYRIHKSVWVCPSHFSQHFWKEVVERGLHKYCKVMLVEILEGDEEARKHFKL